MAFLSTVKGRAAQQAQANTETQPASVVKTYADAQGNVYAADVRLDGQPRPLARVANGSGLRLWKGMQVTVNWSQGSRHAPVILAAAGSEAGAAVQAGNGNGTTSGGTNNPDGNGGGIYGNTAFLMAYPDETLTGAYTQQPGANVSFEDVDPVGEDEPGGPAFGSRMLHARPLVVLSLPSPASVVEGTCADLVNTSGITLGMYRLTGGAWVRRDSGSGTAGTIDLVSDNPNTTIYPTTDETGHETIHVNTRFQTRVQEESDDATLLLGFVEHHIATNEETFYYVWKGSIEWHICNQRPSGSDLIVAARDIQDQPATAKPIGNTNGAGTITLAYGESCTVVVCSDGAGGFRYWRHGFNASGENGNSGEGVVLPPQHTLLAPGENLVLSGLGVRPHHLKAAGGNVITLPPTGAQTGIVLVKATGNAVRLLAPSGATIEGAAEIPLGTTSALPTASGSGSLMTQGLGGSRLITQGLGGGSRTPAPVRRWVLLLERAGVWHIDADIFAPA